MRVCSLVVTRIDQRRRPAAAKVNTGTVVSCVAERGQDSDVVSVALYFAGEAGGLVRVLPRSCPG
jgi:hypothetical protein